MAHRVALLVLAIGCGSNTRPAVQRSLSSLPDDPIRRNEELESTRARPSAESRKTLTAGEQRAETSAATAAAIVGSLLSTTQNTVIGLGVALDPLPDLGGPIPGTYHAPAPTSPPPKVDPTTLVPWVQIKPPPPATP